MPGLRTQIAAQNLWNEAGQFLNHVGSLPKPGRLSTRCGASITLRRKPIRHSDGLDLPPAVFKTCPWQPRTLVETGLRQWLRCCAPAHQVIGMPSRAVDEAWHGLILCTARYSAFCATAYGQFLHHHPDGGAPSHIPGVTDPVDEQLRRTVIAWSLVARPGEPCVLWDLDEHVGVDQPWGLDLDRVAAIQATVTTLNASDRNR